MVSSFPCYFGEKLSILDTAITDDLFPIDEYQNFCVSREGRDGGAVCMYAENCLEVRLLTDLSKSVNNSEYLFG